MCRVHSCYLVPQCTRVVDKAPPPKPPTVWPCHSGTGLAAGRCACCKALRVATDTRSSAGVESGQPLNMLLWRAKYWEIQQLATLRTCRPQPTAATAAVGAAAAEQAAIVGQAAVVRQGGTVGKVAKVGDVEAARSGSDGGIDPSGPGAKTEAQAEAEANQARGQLAEPEGDWSRGGLLLGDLWEKCKAAPCFVAEVAAS